MDQCADCIITDIWLDSIFSFFSPLPKIEIEIIQILEPGNSIGYGSYALLSHIAFVVRSVEQHFKIFKSNYLFTDSMSDSSETSSY